MQMFNLHRIQLVPWKSDDALI